MFLGMTREPDALLGSRLLGCGVFCDDCGLLFPGPVGVVIISGVIVGQVRMVVIGASATIAVTFFAEQSTAATAYCTLSRVRVVILVMARLLATS